MYITIPDEHARNPLKIAEAASEQSGCNLVAVCDGTADFLDEAIAAVDREHDIPVTRAQIVDAIFAATTADDINRAFGVILWEPGKQVLLPGEEPEDQEIIDAIENPGIFLES